jgi:SAM-dependent methyltransferase
MSDRKSAERDFFNQAYQRQEEQTLNGFYELSAAVRAYRDLVLRDCAGLRALEYGCGTGGHAFSLAERGALVTGIDISEVAVASARERAAANPLLHFLVADAEGLPFSAATFDLVCGTSILHHLRTDIAVREIRRVLKRGGRAVFYEPVGYNPAANVYRRLTPELHTDDEHPLLRRDFALIRDAFPSMQLHFFDILSVGAIPFLRRPSGRTLLRILESVDRLFVRVAALRLLSNVVVVEMKA